MSLTQQHLTSIVGALFASLAAFSFALSTSPLAILGA